jgi:hypothetical protein
MIVFDCSELLCLSEVPFVGLLVRALSLIFVDICSGDMP